MLDLAFCLQTRGHEIFVAVRPNAVWREKLNFVSDKNILQLPLGNALDLQSAWQLANFIKQNKIEIVHAHLARDYPLAALAVRLSKTKTPLILTRHVLFPINRLHKLTLPKNTTFIAVSKAVQNALLRQKIVSSNRIKLIHNGIDTRYFITTRRSFNRTTFLERLKLSPKRTYVGIVGEITAHKGQTDFVRAAALLAEKYQNTDFLIIGRDGSSDGKHQKELEKLIAELNLNSRVCLVGWFDDVASALCALDVFVSASRTEPFGLAIVEAMAANLPIVSTRSEGAQEILDDGETGRLVPISDVKAIANAVGDFLNDEEMRKTFGRKAQIRARDKFDLSRMVAETEKVYEEAFGKKA